jgi:hypothetical protein
MPRNSNYAIEDAVVAIPMALTALLSGLMRRLMRGSAGADDPQIFLHQSLIQGFVVGRRAPVTVRGLDAPQQK